MRKGDYNKQPILKRWLIRKNTWFFPSVIRMCKRVFFLSPLKRRFLMRLDTTMWECVRVFSYRKEVSKLKMKKSQNKKKKK